MQSTFRCENCGRVVIAKDAIPPTGNCYWCSGRMVPNSPAQLVPPDDIAISSTKVSVPEDIFEEGTVKEGVIEAYTNRDGIRISWKGDFHKTDVEELIDGKWVPIKGVQQISVTFDVSNPFPVVKIRRIILSNCTNFSVGDGTDPED